MESLPSLDAKVESFRYSDSNFERRAMKKKLFILLALVVSVIAGLTFLSTKVALGPYPYMGVLEAYFLGDGKRIIALPRGGVEGRLAVIDVNDGSVVSKIMPNDAQWSQLDLKTGRFLSAFPGQMRSIDVETLMETRCDFQSQSLALKLNERCFVLFDGTDAGQYANVRIAYRTPNGDYQIEELPETSNATEFSVLHVLNDETVLLKGNSKFCFYNTKTKKLVSHRCGDDFISGYFNRYEDVYCFVSRRRLEFFNLRDGECFSVENDGDKINEENFVAALAKAGIIVYRADDTLRAWRYRQGDDVPLGKLEYKSLLFPSRSDDSGLWYLRSFLPCDYLVEENDAGFFLKLINRQGTIYVYKITEKDVKFLGKRRVALKL